MALIRRNVCAEAVKINDKTITLADLEKPANELVKVGDTIFVGKHISYHVKEKHLTF